jgi:hypothetical protein
VSKPLLRLWGDFGGGGRGPIWLLRLDGVNVEDPAVSGRLSHGLPVLLYEDEFTVETELRHGDLGPLGVRWHALPRWETIQYTDPGS